MKNLRTATLALGAVAFTSGFALAGERMEHRAENNTDVKIDLLYGNAQIDTFAEADLNRDGSVVFDEFQVFAQLDNEYNRFLVLDQNKDKRLSKSEFYSLSEQEDNYDEQ